MQSHTKVILIRHGQTEWNDGARFQGHLDSRLTQLGIRQAEALGQRLAQEKITAIYSSDLGRAIHTAEIIARSTNHKVTTDPRLRERCLGVFQGLQRDEAQQQYPVEFKKYFSRDPEYAVPGGESVRAHFSTCFACLDELAARHPGQTIAIVTHGGALQALFRHIVGIPFDAIRRFSIQNAAYNLLASGPDGWSVITWGDIAHLTKVMADDSKTASITYSQTVE